MSCSAHVIAQDHEPLGISLGATFNWDFQTYVDQHQPSFNVMPALFYDNNQIYIDGEEAGYYLLNDDHNELRLLAYYDGTAFDPEDDQYLKKRKGSVLVGVSYMYTSPIGGLKVQFATDILSRHHGSVAQISYLAELKRGDFTLYPEIGLQWNNKKYNRYYYGISTEDVQNSPQFQVYQPSNSWQPYASFDGVYQVSKRWSILSGVDVNYFGREIYNSPIVDKHVEVAPYIGFLYQF